MGDRSGWTVADTASAASKKPAAAVGVGGSKMLSPQSPKQNQHVRWSNDVLQEDKSRVDVLKSYAASRKETVWVYFLNLLNSPNGYIMNMTARIVAKLACWSKEKMVGSDLQFYITWLKDQLKLPVSSLEDVLMAL